MRTRIMKTGMRRDGRRVRLIAAACILLPALLPAGLAFSREGEGEGLQEEPLYVTYLSGAVEVDRTPDNQISDFQEAQLGMALPAGTVVRTDMDSLCEVTAPDGSVIRIAGGSVFRLERMLYSQATEEKRGRMELIFGRLWSKVQRLVSDRSAFEVVSGTTLAGVRGTSLGVGYDGVEAEVLVFEGSVELQSTTGAFEPVTLRQGETSAVHGGGYREPVRSITFAEMKAWERAVGMELPAPDFTAEDPGREEEPLPGGRPEQRAARMEMHVGSLALGDRVYARLALLPRFSAGRLEAALYLPVIFAPPGGLFDAASWKNHDHWDFRNLEDGIHDALIKIHRLQWGDPGDPVHLSMGSFPEVTLGHGFIVDRYANTLGLPLEPRTGLQAAVDAGPVRAHTLVADASRFQLLAGRLAAGPFGALPLSFGLTAVHDRPVPGQAAWPSGPGADTQEEAQLPRVWVLGADLELPLRGAGGLEAALYADAARVGYTYPELHPDLQGTGYAGAGALELLKGTGLGTGLAGVLGRYSFRLEYRLTFDYFEPGLVGPFWENRRLRYQQELLDLILAQNDAGFDRSLSSGVLLSGGFPLAAGVSLELGYHTYLRTSGVDEHRVQGGFALLRCDPGQEGGFTATLALHRRDNLENLLEEFFDHETLLEAAVSCDIAPNASLTLEARRTSLFDDQTGEWAPLESLGVSTVLRF
ncbi:MAG: FecR family protein [Spirochaetota bacterium]